MQGNFRQLFSTHPTQFIFFCTGSSPHQVEVPSAFPKSKPSAPMRSHNQRSRAHRRYRNLKPLKGNYAPGLTRSTKQKPNAAGFQKPHGSFLCTQQYNAGARGGMVQPNGPGIGVQKTLTSSIPRFPRIGAAAGKYPGTVQRVGRGFPHSAGLREPM